MNTPLVRPAQPHDADAIFSLLMQFAMSYQPDRATFDVHFPQLLQSGHATLFVAILNEQVAGYILGFELLTLYANGPIMELQELMVDPQHRSKGFGRALVEAAIEQAKQRHCVEVVVPTRRARDYYVKLGFVETASYFKRKLS
ncbi:MAG: GNAT family N-acetyltransferase [Abitibacteriaceae bacterium]|nr:GNAT family N-acetyltransferase [Abditibacteriaceae bacterium]MBV9864187.1 GNAT family N-acetyltransferase [Abditibacteriaceae bacterium]